MRATCDPAADRDAVVGVSENGRAKREAGGLTAVERLSPECTERRGSRHEICLLGEREESA